MSEREQSVAIIGYGFVGRAMKRLLPDAYLYDPPEGLGYQAHVNERDVAIVCVPTPNREDGSLDTSIVEEVVGWCECDLILIRSTVNPGTCRRLEHAYEKSVAYVPEYLGETTAHPFADPRQRPFLVIGGRPIVRRMAIEFFQTVYSANVSIRQMSAYEAEVVKLSENRAIAFKIAQAQELYDACEKCSDLDYYAIREAVYGDDPRFNLWHTFVYPEKRGMRSKCIPKDVLAWAAWAESAGASASITREILRRNAEWTSR